LHICIAKCNDDDGSDGEDMVDMAEKASHVDDDDDDDDIVRDVLGAKNRGDEHERGVITVVVVVVVVMARGVRRQGGCRRYVVSSKVAHRPSWRIETDREMETSRADGYTYIWVMIKIKNPNAHND
jgi:hypothetical protein